MYPTWRLKSNSHISAAQYFLQTSNISGVTVGFITRKYIFFCILVKIKYVSMMCKLTHCWLFFNEQLTDLGKCIRVCVTRCKFYLHLIIFKPFDISHVIVILCVISWPLLQTACRLWQIKELANTLRWDWNKLDEITLVWWLNMTDITYKPALTVLH